MNEAILQLQTPAALGQELSGAFMGGMEYARQAKTRSALAAYAMDPSMDSAAGVIAHDPRLGLELRRDEEARMAAEQRAQAQQQGAQREQAMKMAQLLDTVTDENSYQQARNTAQYLGFDLSRVPPTFDPQWVDMNKRIVASFLDHNDDDLPGLAREIGMVHKPGTPEFDAAYRNAITGKYGVDYTDAQGNTRRRSVFSLPGAGGGPAPPPEAIEALRRGEGSPQQFDEMFGPGSAARLMGGGVSNGTGGFRP